MRGLCTVVQGLRWNIFSGKKALVQVVTWDDFFPQVPGHLKLGVVTVRGEGHQQNTISYPTRPPERVQERFQPRGPDTDSGSDCHNIITSPYDGTGVPQNNTMDLTHVWNSLGRLTYSRLKLEPQQFPRGRDHFQLHQETTSLSLTQDSGITYHVTLCDTLFVDS